MSVKIQERENAEAVAAKPANASNLVQRKCSCGGSAGTGGGCSSCQTKSLASSQRSVSPATDEAPRARTASDSATGAGAGHSFGRVPVIQPGQQKTRGADRSMGSVSIRISSSSSRAGEKARSSEGGMEEEQTSTSSTTSGNRIDTTFDPTTTSPRPQCDRIVFVQMIQMTADGSPIMPGTYYSPFTCRDPTALSSAHYIDHQACTWNTPYAVDYGIGTAGSSNGTVVNATDFDAPNTGGGDRRFKSTSNPTGWSSVVYEFWDYAFCAEGTDCNTWYDGVRWSYTKTDADAAAGRPGVADANASLAPPGPGSTVIDAFDQYNSAKGFTPCMYSYVP